jgi:hypothetical protein
MKKPPRYLGTRLDIEPFLRELAAYAFETIGAQLARDIEHLVADLVRYDELVAQELRDLRRENEELEDDVLKRTA